MNGRKEKKSIESLIHSYGHKNQFDNLVNGDFFFSSSSLLLMMIISFHNSDQSFSKQKRFWYRPFDFFSFFFALIDIDDDHDDDNKFLTGKMTNEIDDDDYDDHCVQLYSSLQIIVCNLRFLMMMMIEFIELRIVRFLSFMCRYSWISFIIHWFIDN